MIGDAPYYHADAVINPLIDQWFERSKGSRFFGIGRFNPYDWNRFAQWIKNQHQNGPPPVLPAKATAYWYNRMIQHQQETQPR